MRIFPKGEISRNYRKLRFSVLLGIHMVVNASYLFGHKSRCEKKKGAERQQEAQNIPTPKDLSEAGLTEECTLQLTSDIALHVSADKKSDFVAYINQNSAKNKSRGARSRVCLILL